MRNIKYPINTFQSHIEQNYDIAIKYYNQKKEMFLTNIHNQMIKNRQNIISIKGLEEIFKETMQNIQNNFLNNWQLIYNKKFNLTEFRQALDTWNITTQNINQETTQIQMQNMLNALLQKANKNVKGTFFKGDLTSLKGIDQDKLYRLYWNKKRTGGTSKKWSGLRASVFGEMFEYSIGSLFQNGLNEILGPLVQFESTGGRTTKNPAGITQGKTDIAMSTSGMSKKFNLDANKIIDFNSDYSQINQFFIGASGTIAGINIKQWTDEIIAANKGQASFGNFQKSASLVNKRDPNKQISYVFKDKNTFNAYTGYQVSRFLINILGAYNIIMATGSEITFMDDWLRELIKTKNNLIVHGVKRNNNLASIRKNDIIKGYFEAKKNLIIVQNVF